MSDKLGKFTAAAKTPEEVASEQLQHSEERFRLLVEGVRDYAIYMLDPNLSREQLEFRAERIKGYREKKSSANISRASSCLKIERPVYRSALFK